MPSELYKWLSSIGYHHPLHPPMTHLPVGLVIGAFVFGLAAWIFNRESLFQTARHCIVLALMAIPVTVFLGLSDWQQYYRGVWLIPIRIKVALTGFLILLLLFTWKVSLGKDASLKLRIAIYGLCLATVTVLGFFGGELVYRTKKPVAALDTPLVRQGAALFAESCSMCHYTDSTETKIGPGLKGLFKLTQLPVSKKPVRFDTVADQLKRPFDRMPPFPDLTDEEIESLSAYLMTI